MLILKQKDEMRNRELKDLEDLIFPMLMGSENEAERKKEMFNIITQDGELIASLIYSNYQNDAPYKIQLMKDIATIVEYVMGSNNSQAVGKPIAPPIQRIVRR